MKKQSENGTATVKDFSLVDKSEGADPNGPRNDGSKEVEVKYSYTFDELENRAELEERFSVAALIDLANARLKSTANSGARQKAISVYAQDPNSQDAIRERMIKDAMKLKGSNGQYKTREQAETFVDSLAAA